MARGADAPRFGIYFMPDDTTALARFGAALFDRSPDAADPGAKLAVRTPPNDHPEREARTERAARYGFHATLKAPMRLVDGATEADLLATMETLAATLEPAPRAALALRRDGDMHALRLAPGADSAAIDGIAARCVLALEPLRAPLSAEDRRRRRPEVLDPDALARLDRYGYPWVLDGFDFHMTLARAALPGGDDAHFAAWLRRCAAAAVAEGVVVDRLAVCREARPDARFLRIAEYPL